MLAQLGTVLTNRANFVNLFTSLRRSHGLSQKGLDAEIDESVFPMSQVAPGMPRIVDAHWYM